MQRGRLIEKIDDHKNKKQLQESKVNEDIHKKKDFGYKIKV